MSSNLDSPVRGPTLSTSTSSFEALDPHDPNLSKLAMQMFKNSEEFVTNELNTPLDDYMLLIEMNRATIAKYSDMRQIAENLCTKTQELGKNLETLAPIMDQIDGIELTIDRLEAAAYKLDSYSMALEAKYKSIIQKTM